MNSLLDLAQGRDVQKAILTTHGRMFWITDPRPEDFHIEDMAQGMSLINRFIGHGAFPVNVAQHSSTLWRLVPEELKVQALFHDTTEAYMVDLPRPLKERFTELRQYGEMEDALFSHICSALGLPFNELSLDLYLFDRKLGRAEALALFPHAEEYFRLIGVSESNINSAREWVQYIAPCSSTYAAAEWLHLAKGVLSQYENQN